MWNAISRMDDEPWEPVQNGEESEVDDEFNIEDDKARPKDSNNLKHPRFL